jgi:hypothetical protein
MASRAGGSRVPHTRVRPGQGDLSGALRGVCRTLDGRGAPGLSRLGRPAARTRAHGCRGWGPPGCAQRVRTMPSLLAGSNPVPGGGPAPHHDAQGGATGRPASHTRRRGRALGPRGRAGVRRPDQEADRRAREGTTGVEQADVADWHAAVWQARWEEPAAPLASVQGPGAAAGTASFPIRARARAVREGDHAALGAGDFADSGGAGGAGGVAVGGGLTALRGRFFITY